MKALDKADIAQLAVPAPAMTKIEKLARLAALIENCPHDIYIFHLLEYQTMHAKAELRHPYSAFGVAAGDPVFRELGLASGDVRSGQKFFELTNDELHEFSCDCGGALNKEAMATRIRGIAAGGGPIQSRPGFIGRAMSIPFWSFAR